MDLSDVAAVLLDMDGTLVDSDAAVERAWTTWAGEHGVPPDAALAIAHGAPAHTTVRRLLPHLDEAAVDVSAARQLALQYDDLTDVTALAGAHDLIAVLERRKLPWAVVTSADNRLAAARLRAAGIEAPVLVTAEDVTNGKPDPEGYAAAARLLGVEPARCLVVEDSPAGLAAGRAAGMRTVGVRGPVADLTLPDLTGLADRLRSREPFEVHVGETDLADLRARLARTRWPSPSPAPGWADGIPLGTVQELCRHWASGYDWRATEARLNAIPQYLLDVDGVRIHVLHARSPHPGAMPLILTHGWPGSVLEWLDLAGPLTSPVRPEDAFDVVIPSLPGYGFSDKPTSPGWSVDRIADAWARLMSGLGYDRYGAAGTDWGTSVSSALAARHPAHVAGIHLIPPLAGPDPAAGPGDRTDAERVALADLANRASAYSEIHRTAPQTIGYALLDSPAGLLAWIAEKLITWSQVPPTADQILDQVTLYWLTGTAASSARLYAESIGQVSAWITGADSTPVRVPVGASIFPAEVPRPSRRWAARRYPDIRYWAEHDRGGHFPALEAPGALVADLRAFFRDLRSG